MTIYSTDPGLALKQWIQQAAPDRVIVLADENTHRHCLPLLGDNPYPVIKIPCGERNKNLATAEYIWRALISHGATRNSVLINLGGGMVTDLGGFCASVYQRGIRFVHVPTTLLCMTDAALGGKTGIDLENFKNYIGTFSEPEEIIISAQFFHTLPDSGLLNGWAEVLKHGILSGENNWNFFQHIPDKNDTETWAKIIALNVEIKTAITREDPLEKNIRKTLNLGHSIGHGIESWHLQNQIDIQHGFCVAAGCMVESAIAKKKGLLSHSDCLKITRSFRRFFPKLDFSAREIIPFILKDKKNSANEIRMALPAAIGKVEPDVVVSETEIMDALLNYLQHEDIAER